MPHIITLTGPSGAGKSTVLDYFEVLESDRFKPLFIPKYTTREPRTEELGREKRREANFVTRIPDTCNLVYEQYGVRYGLKFQTFYRTLSKGKTPIVILNDVRMVEDVRTAFGSLVRPLFVFRESPSLEKFRMLAKQRGVKNPKESLIRFQKAQSIYRIYIENIHLFEHVLLNFGNLDDLRAQVVRVVEGFIEDPFWPMGGGE